MQVKSYFPRTVGRPLLVLFWEFDEFIFFIIPIILSIPTRQLLIGLVVGLLAAWRYAKFKKSHASNFMEHMFWKLNIPGFNIEGSPPPHIQEFLE